MSNMIFIHIYAKYIYCNSNNNYYCYYYYYLETNSGCCCVMQWIFPPPRRISLPGTPTTWRSGKHSCSICVAATSSLQSKVGNTMPPLTIKKFTYDPASL